MPKKLKRIKKSSKKQSKIDENRSKIGPGGLLGGLLGHLGPKSQHSSENLGSRTASWASSWRVKSIKIGPKWSPTSIDFSAYFWDRFFIDFGIILGSKMKPKSGQNLKKIDAKIDRKIDAFWGWFLEGFSYIFGAKMKPSWHQNGTKNRYWR